MTKNMKWLIIGIVLLAVLLFINREIYEHRMYMAKAKEAIKEYKYDHATVYLEKADRFPFHQKVQRYHLQVEEKKRASIMAYFSDTAKKEEEINTYQNWVEGEILMPVSLAFERYQNIEGSAESMKELFYQLNFKLEGQRIQLKKEFEPMHRHLSDYIQKNQIAYSYWEQKNPVEAEKIRQEAIAAHTNFLIAYHHYMETHTLQKKEFAHRYY